MDSVIIPSFFKNILHCKGNWISTFHNTYLTIHINLFPFCSSPLLVIINADLIFFNIIIILYYINIFHSSNPLVLIVYFFSQYYFFQPTYIKSLIWIPQTCAKIDWRINQRFIWSSSWFNHPLNSMSLKSYICLCVACNQVILRIFSCLIGYCVRNGSHADIVRIALEKCGTDFHETLYRCFIEL